MKSMELHHWLGWDSFS